MSTDILGIDLGTTNSVAAVYSEGEVCFIENELGEVMTPSVVALDEMKNQIFVGRAAREQFSISSETAAVAFKRSMGETQNFDLGGRSLTPIELSAFVLASLREDAERQLGHSIERCVVTVPAYFGEPQRQATQEAAVLAGMSVERLLNEPTAAAIAYGLDKRDDESQFLIFDLGGGTFDVCVMELFEGLLEVRGVAGESRLGGEDFTETLLALALKHVDMSIGDARAHKRDFTKLWRRTELLKRQLSSWTEASLEIPVFGRAEGERTVMISRAQAAEAFEPLLQRIAKACRTALRGANVEPKALSEIILVGGATRMPCIREFAAQFFGKAPMVELDPDLVVAKGSAIQAALCNDQGAALDIVVTDIVSHSLGVSSTKQIAGRYVDGYFSPVIHRNTTVPVSRTEAFHTIDRNQDEILLQVYEGEHRRADSNNLIGKLEVKGIPKGPAGQTVMVRFTLDMDGLLEIEATISDTGKSFQTVLHRSGKPPSPKDVERFRKKLARLKVDPAEHPRNKDLLLRSQGLWSEVGPEDKDHIDEVLQSFEAALASGDPSLVKVQFDELQRLCERFDKGTRW
ncbi:MAG: Hsp70 family protein [Myxococcales bacterium]|nr:Hsp70 family protein [Myxococcales bacterium]